MEENGLKNFIIAVIVTIFLLLCFHALWAQGPVDRDLASLRAMVRYQLRSRGQSTGQLTDSAVDYAINRAIAKTCKSFPAYEKFDTVGISVSSEGAALNTDFDRLKAVYLLRGDTTRIPILVTTSDSVRLLMPTENEATSRGPRTVTEHQACYATGQRLMVWPKSIAPATEPDSFLVEYYAMGAMLTDTTDSTSIKYAFIDKLISFAAVLLSGTRQNWADAYFYWALFRDDLESLKELERMTGR